jgi:Zn-dependent oligopeptidase
MMVCFTHIPQANQIFAHIENKSAETESTMTFKPGASGNPAGNRHHTRHLLNQKFMQALLLDFEAHGREAIEKCRKQSPLGYVKVLGHLVPREMKVEHSQSLKSMSDEELEAAIELVRGMLAARAGDEAKLIEGAAEPLAVTAPAD